MGQHSASNSAFSSMRESSLHSAIKKWYFLDGDKLEDRVDGFIVDIVRGDLLIEIQVTNFSAIKPKLLRLLDNHKVRLVYPIPRLKWIVHKSTITGETYGRRSPRKGCLTDLFNELVRIPDVILKSNFSIEVLMIEMEETWCNDGRESWSRKGVSIEDRKLLRVLERIVFEQKTDFLKVLPEDLPSPFTNRDLAERLKIPVSQSRKITYVLRKIGAIACVGRNKNQMLFARIRVNACQRKNLARYSL
ncbi:MAG: hypothetical protein N3F08_03590 [Crenarchaeota archaeon]|nr:hypothetical protein [Thermoproteota archaeon]